MRFVPTAFAMILFAVTGTAAAKGRHKKPAETTATVAMAQSSPLDTATGEKTAMVSASSSPPRASAPAAATRDEPSLPERELTSTANPISVAPLLGVATGGLRFGLGARAGYTLSNRVYLGGSFVYHLGTSTEAFGFETSTRSLYPSAEGGYELPLGRVTVRPYGGIALIVSHTTSRVFGQEVSASGSSFGFYPGCVVHYDIPRSDLFVGGDARILFNLDAGTTSLGVFASAGMRF